MALCIATGEGLAIRYGSVVMYYLSTQETC
jgi:hypothetical protein